MDGNGKVQMYHSYEPDGQTTLRFRSYVKNPYRYNAERVDYIPGIADFQYLRARYYNPDTARFIQQDTVWGKIDVPLSQNLYAYCGNNPLNFVDPSGHMAENIKDKIDALEKSLARAKNVGAGLSVYTEIETQITFLFTVSDIEKAENGSERDNCEVVYSKYGKSVTHNNYAFLTDIDLIARLIFHEDSSVKGQEGVAWTIMNRYSQHSDIENLRKELDKYYFAHMKSELDKFWNTNEWIEDQPIQYNIFKKGTEYYDRFEKNESDSTQYGWESAVDIATILVASEGDVDYFKKYISNPFVGYVKKPYEVIQYVNIPSGTKNHFQIGNNMFLKN